MSHWNLVGLIPHMRQDYPQLARVA